MISRSTTREVIDKNIRYFKDTDRTEYSGIILSAMPGNYPYYTFFDILKSDINHLKSETMMIPHSPWLKMKQRLP